MADKKDVVCTKASVCSVPCHHATPHKSTEAVPNGCAESLWCKDVRAIRKCVEVKEES